MFIKKLLDLFKSTPDEDVFVTFMQVALENEDIRQQVLAIVALPHKERQMHLDNWKVELQTENAPEPLIVALSYLEDDNLADRARFLLTKDN